MTVPANITRFLFEIPALADTLRVVGFQAEQGLSSCFRCDLELACENAALDLASLIGQSAVLTLFDAKDPQYLHGEIVNARQEASGKRFTIYRISLCPRLGFLQHRSDLRIFQDQSVPDIVKQVLDEAGIGGQYVRFELTAAYSKRSYCTQYRESGLAFIERLLAEEGIFYFFEHDNERHVLVVADNPTSCKPISGKAALRYKQRSGQVATEESIYDFECAHGIRSGKVSLRDYNFEKSRLQLEQDSQASTGRNLEHYHYPGHYSEPGAGKRLAGLRLQSLQADAHTVTGRSDCARVAVGRTFQLDAHPRSDLNIQYCITAARLHGRQPQSLEEDAGSEGTRFDVEFTGIPATVPYRPPLRDSKPWIEGCQTAFVTGPKGEEIYTDQHGRIKLQFHWDRTARYDEKASCWVRVSQGWAGNQWGAMVIPRIGQEVVVHFLNGDPDLPIVTGTVYNGASPPPCALPEHKTRTTFKTQSTPGGGGYHELRIEDKKGSEEIHVHAEKDVDIHLNNDWREWTGNERHLMVQSSQHEKIAQNLHVTVAKSHQLKTGNSLSRSVGKDQQISIGGSCVEQAGRSLSLKAGMTLIIQAGVELTLKAGGSIVKMDPSGVTIKGPMVRINSGGAASPGLPAAPVAAQAPAIADKGDGPGQASAQALVNTRRAAARAGTAEASTQATQRQAVLGKDTRLTVQELEAAPSWVSIEMKDTNGKPVANRQYIIKDKNGKEFAGTTDANGIARIQGLEQGDYEVDFPDSNTWKKQ